MVTRSTAFGPTTGTADTQTTIGTAYSFPGSGTIKKIRFCGYIAVVDKAGSAILYLQFKRLSGPFEFAVSVADSVTVSTGHETEEIDVDIGYQVGEEVTVKVKGSEAIEDMIVSLTLVE